MGRFRSFHQEESLVGLDIKENPPHTSTKAEGEGRLISSISASDWRARGGGAAGVGGSVGARHHVRQAAQQPHLPPVHHPGQ